MFAKNSGQKNKGGDVILAGALKKLKTARKKWFVLRAESQETARLEYYDSERKFKNGLPPKRAIPLKSCFNINRRLDTKHKHVIALYTKDDCFCVILETDEELETWLKALLSLQRGEDSADGEIPRPTFEHVWQVVVLNRGLGTGRTGNYRLCLTDKTLCLIKADCTNSVIDLNLVNIRSCGSLRNYFYLEIGRSSLLGAGELWMDTDDANIAQNIHTTIFDAMKKNCEWAPKSRTRSSSATESSKPCSNTRRNNTVGVPKPYIFSQGPILGGRERCDSMPSRARTTSDSVHQVHGLRSFLKPYRSQGKDISHSPPSGSPVSPPSVGCSTDSAGSSYSLTDEADTCPECPEGGMRYNIPLTPDEAIAEEECPYGVCDGYVPMAPPSSDDGYVDMSPRCQHNTNNSPSISLTSITSGTPSTDLRFCDYPLDKVSSYFPTGDEDARPIRAYSVGSRPETYRNKRHIELVGTPENSRVRAFSVGSKGKKLPGRVLPPHHCHTGLKSSSAPILSISKTYSSHSSIGPMEDLMELDFSKTSSQNIDTLESSNTNSTTTTTTPSGYVEMKPGIDPNHKNNSSVDVSPYVDMTGSSYMDMSGTSPSRNRTSSNHHHQQQQEYCSFVDINRQYGLSSANIDQSKNYVDMDQRRKRLMSSSSSNNNVNLNNITSTSPSSSNSISEDYLDMSGNHSTRHNDNNISSASPSNNDCYMPLGFSHDRNRHSESQPKTPEGYVEMTVGKIHHQRQSSFDSAQINTGGNDTYANMSLGQSAKKKQLRKEKTVSQPISIYPNVSCSSSGMKSTSSNPMSISSLLGRKSSSSGTPPRMMMHLPLSPYSSHSLERQRKNNNHNSNSHSNSKDSSSSSVTTPSNSSTIFPLSLNSPSSPMKPNKTETPIALKIPSAIFNAIYKSTTKSSSTSNNNKATSNDDYTMMDFEEKTNKLAIDSTTNSSDYVNFDVSSKSEMPTQALKSTADSQPSGSQSPNLSQLNVQETHFRPITAECSLMKSKESKGDTATVAVAVDPLYETLRNVEPASKISPVNVESNSRNSKNTSPCPGYVGDNNSRPSSVTSELSKGPVSRPPSSTSSELWSSSSTVISCPIDTTTSSSSNNIQEPEAGNGPAKPENKLHYASLDLAQSQDEEENQSPKSTKTSNNDSNTPLQQGETTFVYAEIDFVKSEGLKQTNQGVANVSKLKHV